MILETTQLLNNSLSYVNKNYIPVYNITHFNHPASIWTRSSAGNFFWLYQLGLELCKEYTFRYQKTHKCQAILENNINPILFTHRNKGMTPFALCMPSECKTKDPIKSYRNYYMINKKHLAVWGKRGKPFWFEEV